MIADATQTTVVVPLLVVLLAIIAPAAALLSNQVRAIVRNTFFESIRQPIVLVIVIVATILVVLSLPLSSYTMEDDQRMYIDIGLATVFLASTMLAAFLATSVLTREIENRTVLTVVSKPVGRPLFVIGKFLGVSAAIIVCMLDLALVFLLVELHGVQETVTTPYHLPVLVFGGACVVITVIVGVWCNYFYGKVFGSTIIIVGTPLLALAYTGSLMFEKDFTLAETMVNSFRPHLWMAIIPLMIAVVVLTAIAIAASTRLGQVMTLCVTLGVFVLGMLSDWMFGRPLNRLEDTWLDRAAQIGEVENVEVTQRVELATTGETKEETTEQLQRTASIWKVSEFGELLEGGAYWSGYAAVPNFQVLWLSDAVTQYHKIPPAYVWRVALYGALYSLAAIAAATALFQRREVG